MLKVIAMSTFFSGSELNISLIIILILFIFNIVLMVLVFLQRKNNKVLRKKDAELSTNERKFRALYDSLEDIIYIHSIDGRIQWINSAITKHLGYLVEDVMQKSFHSLLAKGFEREWSQYLQSVFGQKRSRGVLHFVDLKGKIKIFEYRNSLVSENDSIQSVAGVARDVTTQMKQQQFSTAHERMKQKLCDLLPAGGAFIDVSGKILVCGRNIGNLLGYSSSELIGGNIQDVLSANSQSKLMAILKNRRNDDQIIDVWEMRHQNGKWVSVNVSVALLSEEKEITEALVIHGSLAAVEKEEDVSYRLPGKSDSVKKTENAEPLPTRREKENKGCILFVDDDLPLLRMSTKILQKLGYEVLPVNRSQEALQILYKQKNQIDVLITDMMMPEMSGFELADKAYESNADLPVIILSGRVDEAQHSLSMSDHIFAFLAKPVDPQELSRVIDDAMQKRK